MSHPFPDTPVLPTATKRAGALPIEESLTLKPSSIRLATALILIALLAIGAWLRLRTAGARPLWVDEAESSINALSILQHGYPTSTYLDVPIYENTLVKPWPESDEFEFRDSSYSDKGVAIYHGWLPLYSMAASFKLFGIKPDTNDGRLHVRHHGKDLRIRTWAARAPALAFSIGLFIIIFLAGRDMGPFPAKWLALLFAIANPTLIWYGQQARYYSLTIFLSLLCIYTLWALAVRRTWIHVAAASLSMILLFYTHLITFVTAIPVLLLAMAYFIRNRGGTLKPTVLSCVIAAGCLPWLMGSGILHATAGIPPGWKLLELPWDIIAPILKRPKHIILVLLGVILVLPVRRRLFHHVGATSAQTLALLLLVLWTICGYLGFQFLMPAASHFPNRMTLSFIGPCLLLEAIVVGVLAQAFSHRWGIIAGCLVLSMGVWQAGNLQTLIHIGPMLERYHNLDAVVKHLDTMTFTRGTKLYATPNNHLTLTFYTGLPFVSVAPVRKSFLDEYRGPIVIIEAVDYPERFFVRRTLQQAEKPEDPQVLEKWVPILQTYKLRSRLSKLTATVIPPLEPLPDFAVRALEMQGNPRRRNYNLIPMMRGFEVFDYATWWPVFMYRFVGPLERMGEKLNYRDRIRNATAELVKDSYCVIYQSQEPVRRSRDAHAGSVLSIGSNID